MSTHTLSPEDQAKIEAATPIDFKEAMRILVDAEAVKIDDQAVTFPSVYDDDEDDLFLQVDWETDRGTVVLKFLASDNQHVWANYQAGTLLLFDEDKELHEITILRCAPIAPPP